ncbi:MAG: PIN domain-containing protein [Acidobacteriota bacterium]
MTGCLVLDAGAVSALIGGVSRRQEEVRAALRAASRLRRAVIIPAVILAELYRGSRHSHALDALLSREPGFVIRNTDRLFARWVGGVLAAARLGSKHLADAHVIAAAAEQGGGLVLTVDQKDLERLAASYPQVRVLALP